MQSTPVDVEINLAINKPVFQLLSHPSPRFPASQPASFPLLLSSLPLQSLQCRSLLLIAANPKRASRALPDCFPSHFTEPARDRLRKSRYFPVLLPEQATAQAAHRALYRPASLPGVKQSCLLAAATIRLRLVCQGDNATVGSVYPGPQEGETQR